ncbi:unnamed protein product [Rotaria magnacalcarata]|uniref:Uncharacterized protein n=2 Tax=Rotaria magnacalcarata TaxID=392030 RepID=A0A815VTB8_9BILA|nr:unnamed protein product [Rotaria magnacalcarata]CAF4268564.1 unnamed protein product [Rotaria magnacalcarata]
MHRCRRSQYDIYDSYYCAITEPGYAYCHLPKSRMYEVHYRSDRNRALRSAYAEKNGTEPRFTTFSSTPNNPNFCATLDYIFFNGRLAVETVIPLPNYLTSYLISSELGEQID